MSDSHQPDPNDTDTPTTVSNKQTCDKIDSQEKYQQTIECLRDTYVSILDERLESFLHKNEQSENEHCDASRQIYNMQMINKLQKFDRDIRRIYEEKRDTFFFDSVSYEREHRDKKRSLSNTRGMKQNVNEMRRKYLINGFNMDYIDYISSRNRRSRSMSPSVTEIVPKYITGIPFDSPLPQFPGMKPSDSDTSESYI